jgi:hypothetical protein
MFPKVRDKRDFGFCMCNSVTPKVCYYNHQPSSSVGLYVLVPRNLTVLSSTQIISKTIIHHKISLHYITEILQFTDAVCMDVTLKLYALLVAV